MKIKLRGSVFCFASNATIKITFECWKANCWIRIHTTKWAQNLFFFPHNNIFIYSDWTLSVKRHEQCAVWHIFHFTAATDTCTETRCHIEKPRMDRSSEGSNTTHVQLDDCPEPRLHLLLRASGFPGGGVDILECAWSSRCKGTFFRCFTLNTLLNIEE